MPIPDDGIVLELGATSSSVSLEFAKKYRLVALTGSEECACLLAAQAKSEGLLDRVAPLSCDFYSSRFGPAQFDAVIAKNFPRTLSTGGQEVFLLALRKLLKPGGLIYLAVENRSAIRKLRGEVDRGGLSRTWNEYRAAFRQAGLKVRETYVSPRGFDNPTELIPLQKQAILHYVRLRLEPPGGSPRKALGNAVRVALAREGFWRRFGSDFAFFLEALEEVGDA